MNFTTASPPTQDRDDLADAIKAGNSGNLRIGRFLHKWYSKGKGSTQHLEAWLQTQGLRLPSEGTRSKYRAAYEAWVVNAGLELGVEYTHPNFTDDTGTPIPMTLEGVSTYALYEARNLIYRGDPAHTLAWVYSAPVEEIKDKAADENERLEPREGTRSLPKLGKGAHDQYKVVEEAVLKEAPGLSRAKVIELMVSYFHDLRETDESAFGKLIRAYAGVEDESEEEVRAA